MPRDEGERFVPELHGAREVTFADPARQAQEQIAELSARRVEVAGFVAELLKRAGHVELRSHGHDRRGAGLEELAIGGPLQLIEHDHAQPFGRFTGELQQKRLVGLAVLHALGAQDQHELAGHP